MVTGAGTGVLVAGGGVVVSVGVGDGLVVSVGVGDGLVVSVGVGDGLVVSVGVGVGEGDGATKVHPFSNVASPSGQFRPSGRISGTGGMMSPHPLSIPSL